TKTAVTTRGFAPKEIKFALDVADEQPEGTIFVIPIRLDDCEVPTRLGRWQWVSIFENNGFNKLLQALRLRARELGQREKAHLGNDDREHSVSGPGASQDAF